VKLLILGVFLACVNDKPKKSYNNWSSKWGLCVSLRWK